MRGTRDGGRGTGAWSPGVLGVAFGLVVTATVLLSACASSPEPENAPAPAPAAEVVAAPPPAAVMAPSAAAGSYRLRTELQRQSAQASRGRTPAETPLTLSATPSAAPQMGAPATTFNATVQIPGYTQAPRGRSAQAAAWWSVPGDSVVVQFARQNGDFVQLRGKKEGTALRGEVWYLSMESGATFQLGTFTATRQAAR